MRQLEAKFMFEGRASGMLDEEVKDYLIKEFVDRRCIFVDAVNPMYEEWNKEFYTLYPGKDGYSAEYSNFIYEKHRDPLEKANTADIGLNVVMLCSDSNGDIYGYIANLGVCIYLTLV